MKTCWCKFHPGPGGIHEDACQKITRLTAVVERWMSAANSCADRLAQAEADLEATECHHDAAVAELKQQRDEAREEARALRERLWTIVHRGEETLRALRGGAEKEPQTPSELLDRVSEFLWERPEESVEDLRHRLRDDGADPAHVVARVRQRIASNRRRFEAEGYPEEWLEELEAQDKGQPGDVQSL